VTSKRVALVAAACVCAACSLVYPYNVQDGSRLGVTDAVASYGTVRIDRWASQTSDKARYAGHWYSDKAPAQSFLALPTYAVLDAAGAFRPAAGPWQHSWTLWVMRLLTGGLAYAALLVLVGRAAERIVPGSGPLTAVAVGVGTFAFGLAATTFSHLAAGALAFSGFLLLQDARAREDRAADARIAAAGLAVGVAVLFDYLAGMALVVLIAYLAATSRSLRRLALFVVGGVPALAALALYDRIAFGSPFHLSYDYTVGFNGREQRMGFFGARLPRLGYVQDIFVSRHGLFLTSPVIVVAGFGLLLLWRERRAEAAACVAIVVLFLFDSAGYFDPIGGRSPGPRYLGAAIPFAAMGLPPLIRARPRLVAALVGVSIVAAIADGVRWAWVTSNSTWMFVDMRPAFAAVLVGVPALSALVLAIRTAPADTHS
jgi:hypothetical protein